LFQTTFLFLTTLLCIYCYIVICTHRSGGADDAHGNQTVLEAAMNQANATWEITRYSGVGHGFTSWSSTAYSPKADYRSWQSMLTVMEELMPMPASAANITTNITTNVTTPVMPVAMPTPVNTSTTAPLATPVQVSRAPAVTAPTGSPNTDVVPPSKAPSAKIANDTTSAAVGLIAGAVRVTGVIMVATAYLAFFSFA
jgi:Dienelactone hydrolase family